MAAATTATSPWADLRDCISDIERLPRPSKTNMAAIHRALQDTWQSHCRKERGEAIQTVALQWSHDFQQVVSGLVQLLLRADPPERRVACKVGWQPLLTLIVVPDLVRYYLASCVRYLKLAGYLR